MNTRFVPHGLSVFAVLLLSYGAEVAGIKVSPLFFFPALFLAPSAVELGVRHSQRKDTPTGQDTGLILDSIEVSRKSMTDAVESSSARLSGQIEDTQEAVVESVASQFRALQASKATASVKADNGLRAVPHSPSYEFSEPENSRDEWG